MKTRSSEQSTVSPFGLKYTDVGGFRLWVRPDKCSFGNLYAVGVGGQCGKVLVSTHEVAGYLGDFAFDWLNPSHAMCLLICATRESSAMRLFREVASSTSRNWLLTNASSAGDIADTEDGRFLISYVTHNEMLKGLHGVYFLSNGRGSVKIGKSENCVLMRWRTLQIASPDELRVIAAIPSPNATMIEETLHRRLQDIRLRGEWFAMTDDEAIRIAIENGGMAINGDPVDMF